LRKPLIGALVGLSAFLAFAGAASADFTQTADITFTKPKANSSSGIKTSIKATETDGMLVLEVHDSGIGMTPDVLKRVGTPFFTTREQGTGLGVAQCQRLVGTAGGRMSIMSDGIGKGTIVTIRLPIAA